MSLSAGPDCFYLFSSAHKLAVLAGGLAGDQDRQADLLQVGLLQLISKCGM